MSAESLPIVCGYCRRPLRYRRGRGLLEIATDTPHFWMRDANGEKTICLPTLMGHVRDRQVARQPDRVKP